jgi:hypothetical protein
VTKGNAIQFPNMKVKKIKIPQKIKGSVNVFDFGFLNSWICGAGGMFGASRRGD